MKKTRKLGVLNKRPPPKNELHKPDENISRQAEDQPFRPLDCWWCIDGKLVGSTITDPEEVTIYATIEDFVVKPTGTNTSVAVGAQAIRQSAKVYLLPTNAKYVRTVSVDFLFMDDGWVFTAPRTITFDAELIATSFVWVRYVA